MQVRHSQRCNETPLSCWIVCESSGEVVCAHCNCMAGLGEVCTHVAAVLFYLETTTKLSGASTCTQEKCAWIVPAYQKEIPYAPVSKLDFSSAKQKMHNMTSTSQHAPSQPSQTNISSSSAVAKPEDKDLKSLFLQLSKCGSKPAILSLVPEYAHNYTPKSTMANYPKPLQSLHEPKFLQLSYVDLLSACKEVDLQVTTEMVLGVESCTRNQSRSKLWFKYQAGRITASKMKAVCRTNPALPSQSLIKSICYPEALRFTTSATCWGCEHEKSARDFYKKTLQEKHDDFSVADSGLVLNPDWPFLGASPDGTVSCACCGKGVLEIKCPYCHRFDEVDKVATEKQSCLVMGSDGNLHLDHSHAYYYQVQTQIFMCKAEYCDFCVCTFPQGSQPSLHIERVPPDPNFWCSCVDSSRCFFRDCLLPELLGKWYTRSSVPSRERALTSCELSDQASNNTASPRLYCYCQKSEDVTQDWIGCDNQNCAIEWFHTKCLNITTIPKHRWYCPDCRKLPEFNVRKKKKSKININTEE